MTEGDHYIPDHSFSPVLEKEVPLLYAGVRLDKVLARLFPDYSRSRIQQWLRQGEVCVDGRVIEDTTFKLSGNEIISLAVPADGGHLVDQAEAIPLDIVYEDDAVIVINKAVGQVVHPGNGNRNGTLLNALLHHASGLAALPRAGIVHRLDKDTSGLMVVARTLTAQTHLVRQLQARQVKRHYYALVSGVIHSPLLRIDQPIGRHPVHRVRMAVVPGGKEAVTVIEVKQRFHDACWVECRLETGRTHQIRVHLSHQGHPLLGDSVYGGRRATSALHGACNRQALHAFQLGLIHPLDNQPRMWQVAMPQDMQSWLDVLRAEGRAFE